LAGAGRSLDWQYAPLVRNGTLLSSDAMVAAVSDVSRPSLAQLRGLLPLHGFHALDVSQRRLVFWKPRALLRPAYHRR
jgi:hypothetical protein